ncbi:MAG: tripartite tricarboxylate transporter TctB family protein [Rhodoferax sp.]
MMIKSPKDLAAGLLFCGVGLAFAWGAGAYTVGSSASMGPGYFPRVLGLLLAVVGLVIAVRALVMRHPADGPIGPWAWRPLVFVVAANAVFGVLLVGLPALHLPAMGLMAAIVGLTLLASLAGERFKLREALGLAGVLALGSYLVFVLLLKLQLAVWPVWD